MRRLANAAGWIPVDELFCSYRNTTDRMMIVRCLGPDRFFLERVVFPFELLTFRCPGGAEVQVWSQGAAGPELLETTPAVALHTRETHPPSRSSWKPNLPQRPIGVRGNASSICLEIG